MVSTADTSHSDGLRPAHVVAIAAEVNQLKAKSTASGGDESQPAIVSPFAGGKAFPANKDANAMTLAAGTHLS